MAPRLHAERCIPAGSIVVKLSETNLPPMLRKVPDFKRWLRFVSSKSSSPPDPCIATTPPMPRDLQGYLVSSLSKAWAELMHQRWVDMTFRVSSTDPNKGILRIYLLPDDKERRDVDRSNQYLRKARLGLLSKLDFSRETWDGFLGLPRLNDPVPVDEDDRANDEDQSLLHMFNNIPPPKPKPELIEDHYAQDAAHELIGDEVVGLKTELWPYQRRSAAVMLQREAQPIRVLDPRLVKVLDQHGQPWYYDRVNGFGLLEPRHYDGVNGGILAEEMGAGKTLICIALILSTKHQSSQVPEIYRGGVIERPKIGSLADMAAAHVNKHALPWKPWFGPDGFHEYDYQNCREYLQRNPGYYYMPRPERRKHTRQPAAPLPARKVYLSYATLVIVPGNLVQQWKQEVDKHTVPGSLRMLVFTGKQKIPPAEELIDTDILLFSHSTFERLRLTEDTDHPLTSIHFKRCIIDEGHKLGSSTPSAKSNLLLALDSLQLSARWVVTGTPAKGLVGVNQNPKKSSSRNYVFSDAQEKDDLKKLGNITTLYLRARPWANTITDYGDKPAEWSIYVLQPKHSNRSNGRKDCLRATLDSLIIRHEYHTVAHLLPDVDEKDVVLEGSYQDRLALNIFSMMITINAVTSQRVDQDYFFHPRQRKALLELVANLRQASFFGGVFFSPEDINKSVDNAVSFLEERKVPITREDESLLHDAIAIGRTAMANPIKQCSRAYREVPFYVKDFPGGLGAAWSLDEKPGDPVLTNGPLMLHLQKFLRPARDAPNSLQLLFESGKFENEGKATRQESWMPETAPRRRENSTSDSPAPTATPRSPRQTANSRFNIKNRRLSALSGTPSRMDNMNEDLVVSDVIADPLARACIISTASAKMTYLLDEILKYQKDEKIIIFYEHDNVAWYISYFLEILDVAHLIYSASLKLERRAQYIAAFNVNPQVRVMLMDIGHAAYGLDLQSASRIYFINPVLDPQIEAQAVGRAKRISQQKPVTVRTLVLKGSIEELIVRRKRDMSQAEQRKIKSILDDKPIHDWIRDPKFLPLPEGEVDGLEQMAKLQEPQFIFHPRFGRTIARDDYVVPLPVSAAAPHDLSIPALTLNLQDGIPIDEQMRAANAAEAATVLRELPFQQNGAPLANGASSLSSRKRVLDAPNGPATPSSSSATVDGDSGTAPETPSRPTRRVRFNED